MGVDHDGFVQLYEELYPRVLAYALRRVLPDDAYDAVDETFLVAWRRRAELPVAPLPWLLVTTRNVLANQHRLRRRQDALAAEVARCTERVSMTDTANDVMERLVVLSALSELTLREREALMLTAWDGLNNRDAARIVGCSPVAFTVRLHRARRRFTEVLARGRTDHEDEQPGQRTAATHESNGLAAGKDVR